MNHLNTTLTGQGSMFGSPLTSFGDCLPANGLDFGYCGIQQTASKQLTLCNPASSGGPLSYQILTDNCPFIFTQLQGKR